MAVVDAFELFVSLPTLDPIYTLLSFERKLCPFKKRPQADIPEANEKVRRHLT